MKSEYFFFVHKKVFGVPALEVPTIASPSIVYFAVPFFISHPDRFFPLNSFFQSDCALTPREKIIVVNINSSLVKILNLSFIV